VLRVQLLVEAHLRLSQSAQLLVVLAAYVFLFDNSALRVLVLLAKVKVSLIIEV